MKRCGQTDYEGNSTHDLLSGINITPFITHQPTNYNRMEFLEGASLRSFDVADYSKWQMASRIELKMTDDDCTYSTMQFPINGHAIETVTYRKHDSKSD